MPPPSPPELPVMVELVIVSVPPLSFWMPPPSPSALLLAMVESVTVSVPAFSMPPPYPAKLPEMVTPEMLAVTPLSTWNAPTGCR